MKRSMIAVCLLLLSPGTVIACLEDHNAGAGWFDVQLPRYAGYGTDGRAMQRDRLIDMALFAGGAGVLIVFGVVGRAMFLSARRTEESSFLGAEELSRVDPFDEEPSCEPIDVACV
jgi:hypothetical protein